MINHSIYKGLFTHTRYAMCQARVIKNNNTMRNIIYQYNTQLIPQIEWNQYYLPQVQETWDWEKDARILLSGLRDLYQILRFVILLNLLMGTQQAPETISEAPPEEPVLSVLNQKPQTHKQEKPIQQQSKAKSETKKEQHPKQDKQDKQEKKDKK